MGEVAILNPIQNTPARPGFSAQQLDLIRRTVASDTTATEFDLFVEVCKRVGLDPFRKQIYALVYSKDKPDKRRMSIITGIDGYRTVAARSNAYRPDERAPEIEYDEKAKNADTNPLGIVKAVVTVFRFGPDREWHPVTGIAYWDEFAPVTEEWADDPQSGRRKPTGRFSMDKKSNWYRMGRVMIAKCAEAQALRKGWPEDLSGLYVAEEMHQADALEVSASVAADAFRADQTQKAIGTANTVFVSWRAGEEVAAVPLGSMVDRCTEFFRQSDSAVELSAWRERNRHALQDFWARAKSDALEVKRLLESRIAELEAA